jgi:hypothetical protein
MPLLRRLITMMNICQSILLFSLIVGLPAVATGQQIGCRSADSETARIVDYVKDLVREPDEWTDSLGLGGIDSLSIVSETDSTACVRVAQVVDSIFEKTVIRPYVVVRAGTRYFAYAPSDEPEKPSELVHVVDNAFLYREAIKAF